MMWRQRGKGCLVLFMLLLLTSGTAFGADVTQQWVSRYGWYTGFSPRDLAVDTDQNVWVAGTNNGYSMYIEKYSPAGATLWRGGYGDGGNTSGGAVSIKVMDGVYVLGSTGCVYNSKICKMALIKYDKAGNRLWAQRREEPDIKYLPYNILLDSEENIYVAAGDNEGWTTYTPSRLILLKYDKDGNLLWQDQYSYHPTYGIPTGIKMDKNGNIYAMIKTHANDYDLIHYEVLKYNRDGTRLWVASTPEQVERSIINDFDFGIDDDGHVFVASYYSDVSTATVIYKYDQDKQEWTTTLKPYPFKELYVAPEGSLGVLSATYYSMFFSKADADGNYLWTNSYGIAPGQTTGDIKGDLYASGSSGNNIYILKYDQAGSQKWVQNFTVGGGNDAKSRSLFVNTNGDIYATGYASSYGGMVAKYSQTGFNRAPAANAGPDQTVECASPSGSVVTLDGSASSDPDGDILTYTWKEGDTILGTGPILTVTLSYGSHTITLTVDDGKGGTASDEVVINVVDTTAPVLNVALSPNVLWPPNHKYIKVTPSITVTDACVETVSVQLLSASSSEPDNGLGDGDTANDIVINSDGAISLRAERSGTGSGRVYTITYQATDIAGNTTTASATVTVPHNR